MSVQLYVQRPVLSLAAKGHKPKGAQRQPMLVPKPSRSTVDPALSRNAKDATQGFLKPVPVCSQTTREP